MLFTTHAVTGGTLAVLTGNATLGFVGAIALHHLLDYVPHCDPGSFEDSRIGHFTQTQFIMAVLDVVIGLSLVAYLYLAFNLNYIFLVGALGGVLPDILGVTPRVSNFWHRTKVGQLHGHFHQTFHNTLKWNQAWFGIGFQVLLVVICSTFLYYRFV